MNVGGAVTVMSSFAAIWWIVGTAGAGRSSLLLYAVGLATSAVLVVIGWRRAGQATKSDVRKHRGRVVGIASGVEGVMIYYLTGALLLVVGLVGTAIQDPTARMLTVCFGAAVVLWLTCAIVLRQNAPHIIGKPVWRIFTGSPAQSHWCNKELDSFQVLIYAKRRLCRPIQPISFAKTDFR